MGRLIIYLTIFAGFLAITLWKRAQTKKRLAQLDRGERCVACDKTEMQRIGPVARCMLCGHKYNVPQLAFIDVKNEALNLAQVDSKNSLDPYE